MVIAHTKTCPGGFFPGEKEPRAARHWQNQRRDCPPGNHHD